MCFRLARLHTGGSTNRRERALAVSEPGRLGIKFSRLLISLNGSGGPRQELLDGAGKGKRGRDDCPEGISASPGTFRPAFNCGSAVRVVNCFDLSYDGAFPSRCLHPLSLENLSLCQARSCSKVNILTQLRLIRHAWLGLLSQPAVTARFLHHLFGGRARYVGFCPELELDETE